MNIIKQDSLLFGALIVNMMNQKEVILTRFYEDESFKQIAREEGLKTATIKSTLPTV